MSLRNQGASTTSRLNRKTHVANITVTKTTLSDLSKVWGSVAKGDLDNFPSGSSFSGTDVFRRHLNKSVGSFNLKKIYEGLEPVMDTSDPLTHYVVDKSHIYQKAGSTNTGGKSYLSRSGEMMISFADNNGYRIEKNFVFGVFHHGIDSSNESASSDTQIEILREMGKDLVIKAIKSFN